MAKLIILIAFISAFAAFMAFRFLTHHAKTGISQARKAANAVNIRELSAAIDSDGLGFSSDQESTNGRE